MSFLQQKSCSSSLQWYNEYIYSSTVHKYNFECTLFGYFFRLLYTSTAEHFRGKYYNFSLHFHVNCFLWIRFLNLNLGQQRWTLPVQWKLLPTTSSESFLYLIFYTFEPCCMHLQPCGTCVRNDLEPSVVAYSRWCLCVMYLDLSTSRMNTCNVNRKAEEHLAINVIKSGMNTSPITAYGKFNVIFLKCSTTASRLRF